MAYKLSDDPDWGHKPSDDDFKIDSDLLSSQLENTKISLVLDTLTKANAFTAGETYLQNKEYDTARAVFKVGADEFHCPLCCTRYGSMLAEDIGRNCMLSKSGGHWCATLIDTYSYDSAIYYLQAGLDAKVPLAAFSMGLYYTLGQGFFPRDEKLGKKYIKMAAGWGFKPAIDVMNEYKKQTKHAWLFGFFKASSEAITDTAGDCIGDRITKILSNLF